MFPYVEHAAKRAPGGAFYIPPQGGGRIDNPGLYSVLYLSNSPPGAIAEAFGRFPAWTAAMLAGSPSLPGSTRAIARYRVADDEPICDLDDAQRLLALNLRPSSVVTREYDRSRAWAKRIFNAKEWSGVSWWSYYDSKWASLGFWDISRFTLEAVDVLELDSSALLEASRTIIRPVLGVFPMAR